MFGKLGLGHFVFSVVSVVVGVLCFLYWDDDSGLWQQGHGWEVWMHVVCGIFYFVPGIFGCLVQKKKNNSMVNICMTTAFYAMVLTAVQILFSTYTIVSAVTSTMIMISVSLIIIAVLEFIICVFTIVTCGKALKDLHKAKMTRSRSRSSFCSRYHPAARFNPIAIETLSDERYPAGRSLVDPGTRQLSYSTTNIAPSKAKVTTSPTGVRKQTRFSSTPNLTFPDPPSEPPPPLEMEPPDLTSRTELMLASHVKSSQSRSSSGHIRSSTPDVAPSRESSLHRNSYREMRREQSLRNQMKSDVSRETAPNTNNQPSGYDHRRLNVQVNSSRDHLQSIELAENVPNASGRETFESQPG
ncbi:uncharacterized protein [Ptychodera flava]|uniref:uncharacterized protein isoform X2 n=1 Tax=Ptychodera flava TaxID=63121 RepID=UPI00396A320E